MMRKGRGRPTEAASSSHSSRQVVFIFGHAREVSRCNILDEPCRGRHSVCRRVRDRGYGVSSGKLIEFIIVEQADRRIGWIDIFHIEIPFSSSGGKAPAECRRRLW